mmetsp:Transcript_17649/g.46128  ORF Transcript_17649/g.46128 Transcript_17649/m.46128 type:complete len:291 (+) Transcript_17649:186-1058(+)
MQETHTSGAGPPKPPLGLASASVSASPLSAAFEVAFVGAPTLGSLSDSSSSGLGYSSASGSTSSSWSRFSTLKQFAVGSFGTLPKRRLCRRMPRAFAREAILGLIVELGLVGLKGLIGLIGLVGLVGLVLMGTEFHCALGLGEDMCSVEKRPSGSSVDISESFVLRWSMLLLRWCSEPDPDRKAPSNREPSPDFFSLPRCCGASKYDQSSTTMPSNPLASFNKKLDGTESSRVRVVPRLRLPSPPPLPPSRAGGGPAGSGRRLCLLPIPQLKNMVNLYATACAQASSLPF